MPTKSVKKEGKKAERPWVTPIGFDKKEYGEHHYPNKNSTSDCSHGCGCWMGQSRSGSRHPGISPFGLCPNNPKDGKLLENGKDVAYIIEATITTLEQENNSLRRELEAVGPGTRKLAKELSETQQKLAELEYFLCNIARDMYKKHSTIFRDILKNFRKETKRWKNK